MTTILITGGSGFIGGHLAHELVDCGFHVRCLVRRPSACTELERFGVRLIQGDITRRDGLRAAVEGTDVVFHLAALTSAFRTSQLYDANRDGARNIAQVCADQPNPPTLVLVSSIAAAGPIAREKVRTERDIAAPISHYGKSKRAGELEVEAFAHLVPTTVVRPGIVFGERNREMLPMFTAIETLRIHPYPGLESPPLSLIYIRDLLEILIRAAMSGERIPSVPAERANGIGYYFAGGNEYPTYRQLGEMLASALGNRLVVPIPLIGPLPWIAAGCNELISYARGVSDSFNVDKIREGTASSWACSSEKAQAQFGIGQQRPLAESLEITANWYREHGWIREPRLYAWGKRILALLSNSGSAQLPRFPASPRPHA